MPALALLRRCVLATLVVVLACAVPSTAMAATGGYAVENWAGCGGGYNSGEWDDAGNLYIPCGDPSTIAVYSPTGELVRSVAMGWRATDVAPSPDGQYIYTAGGPGPRRLVRNAAGSYVEDTAWSPARYPMYGTTYALGARNVAVDGAGNTYWSDGAWAANGTHTVVKYTPSGQFMTRMGEYANSWNLGQFYWMLTGLTVTRDGSTVYTTEVGNNRIQVWQRQSGGGYSAMRSVGSTSANNADRQGYCDFANWNSKFAAPYDINADRAGNLYVINTTCKQVIKFSPGLGSVLAIVDVRLNGGDYPRPHGFAVAADGTVYVGENAKVLRLGSARPSNGGPPVPPAAPAPAAPVSPAPTAPITAPVTPAPAPAAAPAPATSPANAPVPAPAAMVPAPRSTSPTAPGATGTPDVAVPAPAVDGGGATRTLDTAAPRIGFALAARKPTRTARGWGVPARVRCSENCTMRMRMVLRIGAGRFSREVVLARSSVRLAGGAATKVSVPLTRTGWRTLAGPTRIRPIVVLQAADAEGNRATIERPVALVGSSRLSRG